MTKAILLQSQCYEGDLRRHAKWLLNWLPMTRYAPALLGIRFRGLRAKAATDKTDAAGDIRQAQKQLGRTTVGMTENYVRARLESKTDEVANLRSKLQITKRQAARQSHLTY